MPQWITAKGSAKSNNSKLREVHQVKLFLINTVIESLKRTDMTAPIKCVAKSKISTISAILNKTKSTNANANCNFTKSSWCWWMRLVCALIYFFLPVQSQMYVKLHLLCIYYPTARMYVLTCARCFLWCRDRISEAKVPCSICKYNTYNILFVWQKTFLILLCTGFSMKCV